MTQVDVHSADSRVAGGKAAAVAVTVAAAPDSADDKPPLHTKQIGVHFVTAVTAPMDYWGEPGPKCTVAEEEFVVVDVVVPGTSEQDAVAALIQSDLHFDCWKCCLQMLGWWEWWQHC